MPLPSALSLSSSHPPWKKNLADWWVSLSLKKDLPVKRNWMSYQVSATLSYAQSKWSLVVVVASTRNARSHTVRWLGGCRSNIDINDEGQQYGNLDESSAIARVPRKGLVVWCGDHKQTPGRLRKSDEARAFRRKLMRRPIALRGDTKFIPPHMLGAIVHPYVQDVPGPQVARLRQFLHESTRQPLELSTGSVAVLQELCQGTIGRSWDAVITPCCCAALAVLWLVLAPEKFPLQADTFSRAAGTAGKQKWSLILPSSARVSELT